MITDIYIESGPQTLPLPKLFSSIFFFFLLILSTPPHPGPTLIIHSTPIYSQENMLISLKTKKTTFISNFFIIFLSRKGTASSYLFKITKHRFWELTQQE